MYVPLRVYAYLKTVQFEVSEIESSSLEEEMEGSIAKKVCYKYFCTACSLRFVSCTSAYLTKEQP
jgi:hypothetical protein